MTQASNRRWFRFSLWTLFLLTAVAGWFCATPIIMHTHETVMISNHAGMEVERNNLNPALIWPTFALLAIIAWNVVSIIRARHRGMMAADTLPNRRWSFSLRTLFVVVTVLCVWLGWELKIIRERHEARKAIEKNEGVVFTIAESEFSGWTDLDDTFQIPFWRRWLGDEAIAWIDPNRNSSLETYNRIHALFPEAVVAVGGEFQEIRPGDPPRKTLYDAPQRTEQSGPAHPAIF